MLEKHESAFSLIKLAYQLAQKNLEKSGLVRQLSFGQSFINLLNSVV